MRDDTSLHFVTKVRKTDESPPPFPSPIASQCADVARAADSVLLFYYQLELQINGLATFSKSGERFLTSLWSLYCLSRLSKETLPASSPADSDRPYSLLHTRRSLSGPSSPPTLPLYGPPKRLDLRSCSAAGLLIL